MKLYNANFSPNALRTRAVIFELGFEPEIVEIDVQKGENRTPEYLALNPNGKVPTFVDGDVVIHLGPAMQKIAFERVQKKLFGRGEPDEAAIAGEVKTVGELLGVLNGALSGKEWIAGALSLADFGIASTFMLRGVAKLGVEAHPEVDAWIKRLEARPSWQRAVTPMLDLLRSRGLKLD
jgi:glutathione S-transferase